MTVIRKAAPTLRRIASGSQAVTVSPTTNTPTTVESNNDIENSSRASAGVEGRAVTGFTCGLCLTWFPAGTQHACARAAGVIKRSEAEAPRIAMTAEEVRLLAEAGQA